MAGRHLPAAWLSQESQVGFFFKSLSPFHLKNPPFSLTFRAGSRFIGHPKNNSGVHKIVMMVNHIHLGFDSSGNNYDVGFFLTVRKENFMHVCVSQKLLSVVLASALLSPLLPAHANESVNNQTVNLEKPAYFLTPEGANVQLKPGSYQLAPLADSVQVRPTDKKTAPLKLAITMDTHDQDLPEPTAVSVPGLPETDSSDRHILALFMPGGLVYEAAGTYSGIRSRDVDPQSLITNPMNIYLEKPVHFLSPDGEGVEVLPGTYSVESAGQDIRLVTAEKKEGLLLESHPEKVESDLDTSVALSLPGEAEEEADLHYIVLMAPTGESLQALGTYSGIHQRGVFQNFAKKAGGTINRARTTVNRVGQGARHTTQQIGKGVQQTGQNVGRFAQKTALEAKKAAEWAARQAAQGALIAAKAFCKAGLTATRIAAEVQAKILGPIIGELTKALQLDKAQAALRQAINTIKQQQGPAIQQAINAGLTLADPENAKTVNQLMDPNRMCEQPAATVQNTFQKMVGAPLRAALTASQNANPSQVRSRGSVASASIGIGGNLAKIGGGELGVSHAFDFVNKSHWYLDLAAMVKTNVGGGGGVSIGIFPKVNPDTVGGWFLGAGVGFPFPHPKLAKVMDAGLDVYFDFPLRIEPPFKPKWDMTSSKFFLDHFQGFAVSVGAGKSVSPVDIALKAGVGIRLSKK